MERYKRYGMLQELQGYLSRAQHTMKTQTYLHRKDVFFVIGDWAYLKLRPYHQKSVVRCQIEKLAPRYYRSFEILKKIDHVAYRLKLPENARIHNVFHVSQLRKAIGSRVATLQFPVSLTDDMEVMLQPEQVEDVREGEMGREVLVRWNDLPDNEATWLLGN